MRSPRRLLGLKRFTSIGSAIDTLRNRHLAFVNPDKWDDRNDAEFMRLYRNRSGREGLKALCCTESKECDYDLASLPFLKRAGFGPEEEFRIIFEGPSDEDVHFLKIDLAWIRRIVLNPWLAPTISDSVATTFRELGGDAPLEVTSSKLTNSQTWLRWGRSISRRGV